MATTLTPDQVDGEVSNPIDNPELYPQSSAQTVTPPVAAPVQSAAPPADAPPTWDDVKGAPEFAKLTPDQQKFAYQNWVSTTQGYLYDNPVPAKQQALFSNYVQTQAKNLGFSIPLNVLGKPQTIGEAAAESGVDPALVKGGENLPFTQPIKASPVDAFASGLSALLTVPGKAASSIYDWATNTKPGSTALDRGLDTISQQNRDIDTENPGGAEGILADGVPHAVGNFAAISMGGGAGIVEGIGSKGMALFAGLDAGEDTYHNAILNGATPTQAAASAGAATAINAAEMLILGRVGGGATKIAFEENEKAFLDGVYRPTVAEATKYMVANAAGLGALGASGQALQNEANKNIYDPDRNLLDGTADAALQQSVFSLMHLPTLMKAFVGARSEIASAGTNLANAKDALAIAQKAGDPEAISQAQDVHDQAQKDYADLISKTAQDAPPPTQQDEQDATDIATGKKPIPGTNPLDDLNDAAEKELATDPNAEHEQTQETETPVGDVKGSGAEPESSPEAESSSDVAPVPESKSEEEPVEEKSAPVEPISKEEGLTPLEPAGAVPAYSEGGVVPSPEIHEEVGQGIMDSGVKLPIVYSVRPDEPEAAAWADPAKPGRIYVNPVAMDAALKALPDDAARKTYLARTMGEEAFHDAQHSVEADWQKGGTHTDNIEQLYKEIGPEKEKETIQRYGSDAIDPSKGTSPLDIFNRKNLLVREFFRQLGQKRQLGETTEDTWFNGKKNAIVRYLSSLYQKLKSRVAPGIGDASSNYLKATEELLGEAKSKGQEVDASLPKTNSPKPTEQQSPQFRKPPDEPSEEKEPSIVTSSPFPAIKQNYDAFKKWASKAATELRGVRGMSDLRAAVLRYSADGQKSYQDVSRVVDAFKKDVPSPIKQAAITNYIEAAGDVAKLDQWAKATKDDTLRKGYEAAQNLTATEKAWADRITKQYGLMHQMLTRYGINLSQFQNYITHIWDKDKTGEAIKGVIGRPLKTTLKFAKQRTFATYFEGEQAGFVPKTKSAGELLGAYMAEANQVVAARRLVESMSKGTSEDSLPLVAPDTGGNWKQLPANGGKGIVHLIFKPFAQGMFDDYQKLDRPAFQQWAWRGKVGDANIVAQTDMLLHPDAYSHLNNVFSNSKLREWYNEPTNSAMSQGAKAAVKFALDDFRKYSKGTLFGGFPLFHISQEAVGALGYGVNPLRAITKLPPDLNDPLYFKMAEKGGLMIAPDQTSINDFMEGMKANNSLLLKGMEHIPVAKNIANMAQDMTQWTFHTLIPRLKVLTFQKVLARNMTRFSKELASGKVSEDQVWAMSGSQVNNVYGHLNYTDLAGDSVQGHLQGPTLRHIVQIGALAPDFLQARLKHAGSAMLGTVAKSQAEQFRSVMVLGGGLYIGARVMNAALNNGDSHLEPENAFRVVDGNRSYGFRSYIADAAEAVTNFRTFVTGRMSPISRFLTEAISGVNYRGEKVLSSDLIRDIIAGSVPMPLQSVTRGLSETTKNNPVSPFEQLLGSVGVKVSRFAPAQQVYPLAKDWMEKYGAEHDIPVDRGVYPTSKYTPLKYALEDGDYDAAASQWKQLVKQSSSAEKAARGLIDSVNRPFTGSDANDQTFRNSLSNSDKSIFDAAVARRPILIQRFGKMQNMLRNPSK